jgi:hypothetical protein
MIGTQELDNRELTAASRVCGPLTQVNVGGPESTGCTQSLERDFF